MDRQDKHEAKRETGHAKVYIDWRFIERLLQLPEGVEVAGIYEYPPIAGMVVHLIGDALPRTPRNQEPETIWPDFHYEPSREGGRMVVGISVEIPNANKG